MFLDFRYIPALFLWDALLFDRSELVLSDTADRTYPVIGKVFESYTWSDASVRVAYRRVVNPVTYFTYILFHIP